MIVNFTPIASMNCGAILMASQTSHPSYGVLDSLLAKEVDILCIQNFSQFVLAHSLFDFGLLNFNPKNLRFL